VNAPLPLAGLHIVVVEDDAHVALDVQTGLRWAGAAAVDVAVTARQVQQRLALPPGPDIVLIDFYIGGDQFGLDVARWLRRQPTLQHTLRILHTSADLGMIRQQSPDDQLFHAVISKPVPLHSLIEQLTRVLQQR